MTTDQQRLDALNRERLDQTWWPTPPPATQVVEDDLTTARRRRLLDTEYAAMTANHHKTEVS